MLPSPYFHSYLRYREELEREMTRHRPSTHSSVVLACGWETALPEKYLIEHNSLMPNARSAIGETRLENEQALARLRQLQAGALEGRLLNREQVRAQCAQAFAALRDRALGMAGPHP